MLDVKTLLLSSSRFSLHKFWNQRHLTYQQATSTLRPFFFAVHPDFFQQKPEQRMQNEQSLKLLNARLISLNGDGGSFRSSHDRGDHLIFFLRKTALSAATAAKLGTNEPTIKPVQISLEYSSLQELVRHILQISNLPLSDFLNYVQKNNSRQKQQRKPNQKTQSVDIAGLWEDSDFYYEETSKPFKQTGASWLMEHLPRAIEFHAVNEPIREVVATIESTLIKTYGLSEIFWKSEWTPGSHAACLRALSKILSEDRARSVLPSFKGKRIIFAQRSGISVFDDILLSVSDVPETWLSAMIQYHSESALEFRPRGHQLSSLEKGVSLLLYGAHVMRHPIVHDSTLIKDYYFQVRNLFQTLLRYTKAERPQYPKGLFSNLKVAVEDVGGSLSYAEDLDIFLIPAGTPGFLIADYLLQHQTSIEKSRDKYVEDTLRYSKLCEELVKDWGLVGIRRDPNVSLQQGLKCLETMSSIRSSILPHEDALSGLELCIAHYHAVGSSGIIYIQWDCEWL